MKASNKKSGAKRKRETQMEEIDLELEQADFSEVTVKHVVKMAELHEARENLLSIHPTLHPVRSSSLASKIRGSIQGPKGPYGVPLSLAPKLRPFPKW